MEINDELLAAYTEDNVSDEEREAVRHYLVENPEAIESVMMLMDDTFLSDDNNTKVTTYKKGDFLNNLNALLDDIDSEVPIIHDSSVLSILPMKAMAAKNIVDNKCAIRCEGIALRHFGINISNDELFELSEKEGWIKPEGTALHDIGRLAGIKGLSVSHRYNCKIEDIKEALANGNIIIAAIDGNELLGDLDKEQEKDDVIGSTPNHVVIIDSVSSKTITITDSATNNRQDTYPLKQFIDAWLDSSNYLVIISNNDVYTPHPIDLSNVEIENELIELREAIAENAHEVWAETRSKEGWTYGPVRDDTKKQHPDMLPYNRLPESEKEYDRLMAINTIKLVKKLGWEFRKKN